MVKNSSAMQERQEMRVQSLGQEEPLEKERQPTPVFLPGKSYGQRILVGCGRWGHKELDMTEVTSYAHAQKTQESRDLMSNGKRR